MYSFLLLIPFVVLLPQEKYFIYFKDKGEYASLQKSAPGYQKALEKISPRALERRKKVMNSDSLITYEDLPVSKDYISLLSAIGVKVVNELDWFNAVSAYLDNNLKDRAENLPFVRKIVPVKILTFRNEQPGNSGLIKTVNTGEQDYGNSYETACLIKCS